MTIVDRTCTEVRRDEDGPDRKNTARPLGDYRDVPAYVLLGDPGAGKTTCLRRERERAGDAAEFVSARDFVTFDAGSRPKRQGGTLFIDGLDEVRAGDRDGRTALDRVRARLDQLGRPPFRLSCREADWLGRNDLERLKAVVPEGKIEALRLDPLTPDDARRICRADARVVDAERFLREAEERGFRGLLANPQNLKTLIQAVGGTGRWPASRLEAFELACKRLTTEPNDEHRHSLRERPAEEQIMEAAGRICALLLLSGTPGASSLPAGEENEARYLTVERLDPAQPGTAASEAKALARVQRLALSCRLFAAGSGGDSAGQRLEPVHRHIAEFLAGRYLARQIDEGLPAARVAALITGRDGGVVTPHRGLSAWLAAHSRPGRREMIDRDPVGAGLYGDITGFSGEEKQLLLQALIREGRRLDDIGFPNASVFAPLVVPALETEFHDALTAASQSEDNQFAVKFLLRVLSHGQPLATLVEPVEAVLYGEGWREGVVRAALDALIRQCPDRETRTGKLKQVLSDIQSGRLLDPDNELVATVFEELYPETIGPSEIWRQIARFPLDPARDSLVGRHSFFWAHSLEEKTPDESLPLLLDALAEERPDLSLIDNGGGDGRALAERLLARALALEGDKVTPRRLHAWLNAPARTEEEFRELRGSHELREAVARLSPATPIVGDEAQEATSSRASVRSWLEAHPDAYKAALREGIRQYDDEWDLRERADLAMEYLRHAQPPPDVGRWCLNWANETAETKPDLARWLMAQVRGRLEDGEEGLDSDLIDEVLRKHPALRQASQPSEAVPERREAQPGRTAAAKARGTKRERRKQERREAPRDRTAVARAHAGRRERRKQERLEAFRVQLPALRENRANPALLWNLANEWLTERNRPIRGAHRDPWMAANNWRPEEDRIPLAEWLDRKFDTESELAAAVAAGLRGVIDREDVPDAGEILRLRGENRVHYLSRPLLISLDERDLGDYRFVDGLTDRQKRQACAFHLTTPGGGEAHPNWYRRLLERDVELAADVLIAVARLDLRRGKENVRGLWDLAHDAGHASLARIACLRLLRGFPVRCHARQLPILTRLLWAALRHADREALLAVIEKKLAGKSMTVSQRVHWLAAGLIAAPDEYVDRLAEFVGGKELRARQLASFLWLEHPNPFRPEDLPPRALEVLVRLSGDAYGVSWLLEETDRRGRRGGHNAQPESVLWRIPELIDRLAASPEREAGEALRRLADDEALERWGYQLRRARDRQAVVSRDSSYRRSRLDQVRATLDNLAPANAADLAALALDRLDELARSVRTANTNDWSQYWNQDGHGRPTGPKAENDCRNALLRDLRTRLPDGVDAQPEGRYAADRRADIRLSCSDFNLPIEIKKSSHPALYRSARDQLVAKYTRDPATGGWGIFLPLWFGDPEKAPLDETGTRPGSPEELRERLEACLARQLQPDQRRKIAVRVVDVSKP